MSSLLQVDPTGMHSSFGLTVLRRDCVEARLKACVDGGCGESSRLNSFNELLREESFGGLFAIA